MAEPTNTSDSLGSNDAVFVGDVAPGKDGDGEWTQVDPTTSAETDDDASQQSKNLKNEINIIQELLPTGGEAVTVDTSNDEYPPDPVQKVLEGLSKSVEPVQKGIDENVQKFQSAMDEHVKPHLDKAKAAIDEHVAPHVNKVGQDFSNFHSQTKAVLDEHVAPKLREISTSTSKGFEDFGSSTRKAMEEHVTPQLENLSKSTVQGLQETGKILQDIPGNSKRVLDEHVGPAMKNVQEGTTRTLVQVGDASRETYQKHLQPQVDNAVKVHTSNAKYYMGTAPALFDETESRLAFVLAESSFRAIGRVVFCDNPVTGGFVWLAMLVGSPMVAICALASVTSYSFCALYMELDKTIIRSGTLGPNAVLVGAGCAAFFEFHSLLLGCVGSILLATLVLPPITLLMYIHTTKTWLTTTPPLLIPYNMVMLAVLLSAVLWNRAWVVPAEDVPEESVDASPHYKLFAATLNGLSAIFLVEGIWSGVFILAGVLLCSRILAAGLVLGSLLASLLALVFEVVGADINGGIAGYEAALTAAALVYYFQPSKGIAIVGVFAIILTCLIQTAVGAVFMEILGLPVTLTFGFCLATLPILALDTEQVFGKNVVLKRIPEEDLSTPEEYWKHISFSPIPENLAPAAGNEDAEEVLPQPLEVETDSEPVATEDTPLIAKPLDV